MAVIAKAPCPRCLRPVAVMRWEDEATPVPFRHKDRDGEWCSGTAKDSRELLVELVGAVQAERVVLRKYTQEMLRHLEAVVAISDEDVAAQEVTTALMRQTGDALNREAAEMARASRARA